MKNSIRVERAIKDITQEDLSRLVQVSRQTINAIESGKYVPSTLLSLKISTIFKKNVNDIFQLEESDWKES
jgi:putative transcriptional regulator